MLTNWSDINLATNKKSGTFAHQKKKGNGRNSCFFEFIQPHFWGFLYLNSHVQWSMYARMHTHSMNATSFVQKGCFCCVSGFWLQKAMLIMVSFFVQWVRNYTYNPCWHQKGFSYPLRVQRRKRQLEQNASTGYSTFVLLFWKYQHKLINSIVLNKCTIIWANIKIAHLIFLNQNKCSNLSLN